MYGSYHYFDYTNRWHRHQIKGVSILHASDRFSLSRGIREALKHALLNAYPSDRPEVWKAVLPEILKMEAREHAPAPIPLPMLDIQ